MLSVAWARVPRFGTSFGTFIPLGVVIRAVDRVRNRLHMAKLRKATLHLGFPLERNMAMVVTPRRLLIWKAHRHPRSVGEFLGEVPQSRIITAKMPFSNTGPWRTMHLSLTDTTPFRFQVDSKASESLILALDKAGGN